MPRQHQCTQTLLTQLAELFISAGQNAVCLGVHVWMLTRVVQIVAAAHRGLLNTQTYFWTVITQQKLD